MFIRLGDRFYNIGLIASIEPFHADSVFRPQYFALMTMAAVTNLANEALSAHEIYLTEDEYHSVVRQIRGDEGGA